MRLSLATVVVVLCAAPVHAVPFTPGNLVVYRVGSGSGALVTTGNPVFLDEFTPAGVLVQTIALPTSPNGAGKPLVASGTATSDGFLTRSDDGTCLAVPGYGRDIGVTVGNVVTTAGIPRVVARVTASGAIDTTTALTDAAVVSNFRSAATATCGSFWVAGGASGIRYAAALGATTSIDLTGATFANTRALSIFGNQLYVSASVTAIRGVAAIGTGLPISGAQTLVKLPGMSDTNSNQPYAFFIADLDPGAAGVDTMYVTDDTAGTLTKFSKVSGGWIVKGIVATTTGGVADAYRGLTGVVSGATVTLYATRNGNQLVSLIDATGYNGGFAGPPTLLATAVTNTAFRGVVLSPAITMTPSAGAHGTISPATPQAVAGSAIRSFTITPETGYAAVVGGTCGGTLAGATFTTAPATANCTVEATFTLITFTVTPSAGLNGTINPGEPRVVPLNGTVSFAVAPAFGYSASVGGTCGGAFIGTVYTTNPIVASCSVDASFPPLPRYLVSPSVAGHGTVSPAAAQTIVAGQTAVFEIAPEPGYSTAVRGTCGGVLIGNTFTSNPAVRDCSVAFVFARKLVLFVGNSFTFGRIDPVMSYNTAHVTDLTSDMWLANMDGSNADEPHPWGGIPGIFKMLTDQAGLDYDVSISARNAASLRGHYLNSNPVGWDLRGNMASQKWDTVVLQDLSDEPLPAGRGANANLPYFDAYVDKVEAWIHAGAAEILVESELFGGSAALCHEITGASATACNRVWTIAPSTSTLARARRSLYETWARPDMIGPNGTNASGQFYTASEGLEAMTSDFHSAYFGAVAANPNITGVSAVGDAFLRAVQLGIATRDPYVPDPAKLNLWHTDGFHPSKYGSYLSALVHYATITGRDPMLLGGNEQAAVDLGIAPTRAAQLQLVARLTVIPDTIAPVSSTVVSAAANDQGWNTSSVTITFGAADNSGGVGLGSIDYSLAGAQVGNGSVPPGGAVTIAAEGITSIAYFAADAAGNAEPPHTFVIRVDATPPVITVPASFAVDATAPAGALVTYAVTGADNSGLQPALSCLPGSGSTLPIGTTAIGCIATDRAGHTATAGFSVTVRGVEEQTTRLVAAVVALPGVNVTPIVTSLIATHQAAIKSGNATPFCAGLTTFARQMELWSGRGVPAAQAADVVAAANRIRAVQGCR